jgi:crotonobetainyl-CoA:carnitine CoA-transferase CaiB-like acyl-CoA transferase
MSAAPDNAGLPPLHGVRVLDLSRVLAGPLAGQVLGDLGAEVIKVERPQGGDDTRAWGPPWWGEGEQRVASYFLSANRNKKSIAIDLASPGGQALVHELVAQCDVLIENFKVGGLRAYGLDAESLLARHPRLVYCSVTGFGQTGPYSPRAGYDFLMQGLGGLMSVTGQPDGAPGAGPMKVGVALTDVMTGLYAVISVQAALAERARSGRGQHIDLALLDVQVAGLANQALSYLTTGRAPRRMGNAHPSIVPYQDFPTTDGHMVIAVGNDGQFAKLAQALGAPDWASDARFATNAARVQHRDTLVPLIGTRTRKLPSAYWSDVLQDAGVPCGPINDLAQVFADPHLNERGVRVDLSGTPGVASPMRFSRTPVSYRQSPPGLGEHTDEVLGDLLGIDPQRLAALKAAGTIR